MNKIFHATQGDCEDHIREYEFCYLNTLKKSQYSNYVICSSHRQLRRVQFVLILTSDPIRWAPCLRYVC